MTRPAYPLKKNKKTPEGNWLARELLGLLAIFVGLLLALSLGSFDVRDPWPNQVISGKILKVYNKAGLFGSYTGGLLFDVFGLAAWVFPFYFCFYGGRRVLGARVWPVWRWLGIFLLGICLSIAGAAHDLHKLAQPGISGNALTAPNHGGGLLGYFLHSSLLAWFNPSGTLLVWLFSFLLAVQMIIGFSWFKLLPKIAGRCWQLCLSLSRNIPADHMDSLLKESQKAELHQKNPFNSGNLEAEDPLDHKKKRLFPPLIALSKKKNSSLPAENKLKSFQGITSVPLGEENLIEIDLSAQRSGLLSNNYADSRESFDSIEDKTLEEICRRAVAPSPAILPQDAKKSNPSVLENNVFQVISTPCPLNAGTVGNGVSKNKVENMPLVLNGMSGQKHLQPLPESDILEAIPAAKTALSYVQLESKGKSLMTCLNDFGIDCELVKITPGPVVTMFELRPAPGVRVSRIANLSDDLALSLKSVAVRVQAPIPGTDTVGIEIPNEIRELVCFKEIIQSNLFRDTPMRLPLALGKDISGEAYVADLASMPHLLVAGATGAGKSVGINSILLSLLLKARPDAVKLLLVDPKRVEMAIYADLPHLVHPVVTEMSLAKNALDWAVAEMDKRYAELALAGVRNITDFNAKLSSFKSTVPEELKDIGPMPYLIIVIDELADLMLTGSKEIETSIVRLAQLARAAGIHLILATQRPSVDVVTGLIKANFPCRIAFQVTSKHDSRTILDATGAEYLLGKGDMLFKQAGGRFLRLHGAYVSDKNVHKVCDYWKKKQKPDYSIDFNEWGQNGVSSLLEPGHDADVHKDALYAEACEFVRQQGQVSISRIQRRFRIGFNKAARFVEQMEQDGIITPADGSKLRQVIR